MKKFLVSDIMTQKKIIAIDEDTNLQEAEKFFEEYGYKGFPVVDKNKKLVGILTEYDMVSHSSGAHIPTMMSLLENIKVNRQDRKDLDEFFKNVRNIKVKNVMNTDPLTITEDTPIEELAKNFSEHHKVNPILVTDKTGNLRGVVSRYDILRFFNEKYLHNVLAEQKSQEKNIEKLKNNATEGNVENLVSELSESFILVNKRRPRIWKIIAIIAFLTGFITAVSWILRISWQ